jgi:hypothetical protein
MNAAHIAMGVGVSVIAYGSLAYLMGGATSIDPAPVGIGVVILLVAAVWSRSSK